MMRLWKDLKGRTRLTYPYVVFTSKQQKWAFSYKRHNLVLSSDTTTPYSILHFGPYEFFIRPKSKDMDWF